MVRAQAGEAGDVVVPHVTPYLVAGILAGTAGLVTFLVVHHFWIQPIWAVLPAGLLISAIGGLAVGWSYAELAPALPARPLTVIAVLALIALVLAPSVLLAQVRPPLLDVVTMNIPPGEGSRVAVHFLLELVLTATLMGASAGWLLAHTPQAALATALAGLVYALGPGHNIPLLGNTPAVGKGLILLFGTTTVAALVLVETTAWLVRR